MVHVRLQPSARCASMQLLQGCYLTYSRELSSILQYFSSEVPPPTHLRGGLCSIKLTSEFVLNIQKEKRRQILKLVMGNTQQFTDSKTHTI